MILKTSMENNDTDRKGVSTTPFNSEVMGDFLKRHYGLITLSFIKQISKGLINTSFFIEGYRSDKKVRGCLRIYPVSKKHSQIRFEHNLLKTLERRSFKSAPILIPNTQKETITPITLSANPIKNTRQYAALFNTIEGTSPYDWNTPFIPLNHLEEAGNLLGRYHNTIKNDHPQFQNDAFQGMALIQDLEKRLSSPRLKHKSRQDVFYELLHQNRHLLSGHIARLKTLFTSSRFLSLPRLIVHGDFHPGNLRIFNNRVTALLDFDWSHENARVVDLGLSLTYFAFPYPFDQKKNLSRRAADAFISGYLCATDNMKEPSDPLSLTECQIVTPLITYGHLLMLSWAVTDFSTNHTQPPAACLTCLKHTISAIKYIDAHDKRLGSQLVEWFKPESI